MRPLSWAIVLSVVNIPVYVLLARIFFNRWDEVREAARFRPTPGFLFLVRGDFKDWRAELKLVFFMIVCAAAVYGEYLAIQALVLR